MERTYVVRVVVAYFEDEVGKSTEREIDLFVEQLRYAGLVHRHNMTNLKDTLHNGHFYNHLSTDGSGKRASMVSGRGRRSIVFDILPPDKAESKAWAKQVAERMQTFGYNAEVAPKWEDANA